MTLFILPIIIGVPLLLTVAIVHGKRMSRKTRELDEVLFERDET